MRLPGNCEMEDLLVPTITVTVERDGEPASGHRVTLENSSPIGGMIGPDTTDDSGRAYFDVEDGQEGVVYVDGANVGHWGSYSATDVTVSL